MDKFAVLKIQKKAAAAAARAALGLKDGDILAPQEMSEEAMDAMNLSFGYPVQVKSVFCVGKTTSAAVWWIWEGDMFPDPLPLSKEEEEALAAEKAAAEAQAIAEAKAKREKDIEEGLIDDNSDNDEESIARRKKKEEKEKKARRKKMSKKEREAEDAAEKAAAEALEEEEKQKEQEAEEEPPKYVSRNLTGWEIARYRKNPPGPKSRGGGEWLLKGSITVELQPHNKMQFLMEDLGENSEYRFTVRAINARGKSKESPPSNSVMVEQHLPAGWFRFFDEKINRQYYANLKTAQTSWNRPDQNPYFLDELIVLMFNKAEMKHLRALFDEEIAHFKMVLRERFPDILREIGERMSNFRVRKLFKGYGEDEYEVHSWTGFMDMMMHIKKKKIDSSVAIIGNVAGNASLMVKRQVVASMLNESKKKMGNWKIEYSNIAERNYYVNSKTKETQWDMPDDIRFFLPPKLENQLHKAFDYGHMETFKQYFSMLDVESKGDLSDKELSLLLKALNLDISDENFEQLVKTVDLNGNGTIEYDEFCWMMYELARTDNQGSLADMFPASAPPAIEGDAAGGGDTAEGAAAAATTTSSSALMLDFHKLGQNLQKLQNETKTGSAEALELTITPTGQIKPKPPSGNADSSEKQLQQVDEQNASLLAGNISSSKATAAGGGGGAGEEEQVPNPSFKEKPGAAGGASSTKVAVVVMDEENEGTARSALTDRTSVSSAGGGRKSEHGEEGKETEEAEEEEEEEEVEEEETLPDDESDDEDGSLARMRAEKAAKKARRAPPKMSIYAKFELGVWRIFHPKQAKAMDISEAAAKASAAKKAAAKERKRLETEKSDAARNAATLHGPFCFCGCRGY